MEKISKYLSPIKQIVNGEVASYRNSATVRVSKNGNKLNVVTTSDKFVKPNRKTVPNRIIAKFNGVQRIWSLDSASNNAIVYKSMVGDKLVLVNSFDKKPNPHI